MQQSYPVIEFMIINSIYSLILAALVLFIKWTYPRLPQSVEYGFWCVVLIRLILPNDLSFDYAIINLFAPLIEIVTRAHQESQLFSFNTLFSFNEIISHQQKLLDYVFLTWLAIVSLIFLRYANLRLRLIKMINTSSPVVDYWPVRCANRWRLNFWIKRRVIIIAADKFLSPFTFSFVNPIIFIPKKILETQNEPLIESIIAHEMAHIKRQDSLWLVLQNMIQIVYFFNPFVWLIVSQLSSLRENICDSMVLSVDKIKPEQYGNSLLQVLRFNISGDNQSLLPSKFLGHKDQIKKRVAAIGNYQLVNRRPVLKISFVFLFAIFLLPFADKNQSLNKKQMSEVVKIDSSPFSDSVRIKIKLTQLESSES